jgi:hypothetical protein
MAQPGQFLEIMMANLQSYLGPQGADVRLREKFFNPVTGKQIGELDITVRGDFGASKFFCAIECRDRPADGPQGLPWITQILGKKRLLNPDKMTAVSSTGFTDDAQVFAAAEGIDLITIANPTEDILREWFQILDISYTDWRITTAGPVTVNLLDPTREPPAELLTFSRDDPVFIVPPSVQPRSLGSLQIEKVQGQLLQLLPNQTVRGIQLEFVQPISLVFDGQVYPLRNVLTPIDIVPHSHVVRALLNACHRLGDSTVIALAGTAKISIKDKQMIIMIIAKKDKKADGTMSVKAHFYDREGNETTLPKGIVMGIAVE